MNERGRAFTAELAGGIIFGAVLGELFLDNAALGLVLGLVVVLTFPKWRNR
jgi:F0F1-type ATP synthase assembly protein I